MTAPQRRLLPNRRDAIAGLTAAIAGVTLFTAAQGIGRLPGDTETIGPAVFPTALSVILVAAGLLLGLSSVAARWSTPATRTRPQCGGLGWC